jgi:hypothetical protein
MAYELIFNSTERSETNTNLVVRVNQFNEVSLTITNSKDIDEAKSHCVTLEKTAAIKLAKELRRQISYLQD